LALSKLDCELKILTMARDIDRGGAAY
jgi:hypothetical protein